ncbi:MAG: tRNA (adenosine(37)-N6)-threonylcarbamoyltransferase complex dimerization subunit type 1 TsaB [bacterium]
MGGSSMNDLTLSLETSAPDTASWALFQGDDVLRAESCKGKTSSSLFPSLQAGIKDWSGIQRILVGVGPGSFSGIRVAIAAAHGIQLVHPCEIIPVRSSHAVAWQHQQVPFLGVFAQARREEYFVTCYERGKMTRLTQIIAASQLEDFSRQCALTVSAEKIPGIATRAIPDAVNLARYFLKNGEEGNLVLEPVYVVKQLGIL